MINIKQKYKGLRGILEAIKLRKISNSFKNSYLQNIRLKNNVC